MCNSNLLQYYAYCINRCNMQRSDERCDDNRSNNITSYICYCTVSMLTKLYTMYVYLYVPLPDVDPHTSSVNSPCPVPVAGGLGTTLGGKEVNEMDLVYYPGMYFYYFKLLYKVYCKLQYV